MQSKMKIFAVLLVSSVALCLATSDKKAGSDKNHQKRGLLGLAEGYGGPVSAPFIPSPQLIANTNEFVPSEPIHYGHAQQYQLAAPAYHHHAYAAAPAYAAHAYPAVASGLHLAAEGHGLQFAAAAAPAFESYPLQHAAAPAFLPGPNQAVYAQGHGYPLAHAHALPLAAEAHHVHAVPTHVKTHVKTINVPVPYERQIPIDNPIYTHVEKVHHVDNPVPVVKIVKQPVPVHIEEQVPIPVHKEIRIPAPYYHKVRLIIQRVIKEVAPVQEIEAPRNNYLPPPPPPQNNYLPPVQQLPPPPPPPQPQTNYLPPTPQLPQKNYLPPVRQLPQPAPEPHFNAPALPAPEPHFDAPAPPSTNYGPPAQDFPPNFNAHEQQHFNVPQQQPTHFNAPLPQPHFNAPAPQTMYGPPSTNYGAPQRQGY